MELSMILIPTDIIDFISVTTAAHMFFVLSEYHLYASPDYIILLSLVFTI